MAKNANDAQEAEWYKQHLEKLKNIKQKTIAKPASSQEDASKSTESKKENSPLKRKVESGPPTPSLIPKVKIRPEEKHPSLMSLRGDARPVRPRFFGPRFNQPPIMQPGPFFRGRPMGPRPFPPSQHLPNMRPGFIRGPLPRNYFWPEKKIRPAAVLEKKNIDNKKENIAKKNEEAKDITTSQSSDKKPFSDTKTTTALPVNKNKDGSIIKEESVQLNKTITSMKNDVKSSASSATVTKANSTATFFKIFSETSSSVVSKQKNITAKDSKAATSLSAPSKTSTVATTKQSIISSSPSAKPVLGKDVTKPISKTVSDENLKQPQTGEGVVKITPKKRQEISRTKNITKQDAMTGTISKNATKSKTAEDAKLESKEPQSGVKTNSVSKLQSPAKNSESEHSQAYLEHLQKLRGKTKTVVSNASAPVSETKNLPKTVASNTNLSKPVSSAKNLVKVEYPYQKPIQSKSPTPNRQQHASKFQNKQFGIMNEQRTQTQQRYQGGSSHFSELPVKKESKTKLNRHVNVKPQTFESKTEISRQHDAKLQSIRTGQFQRSPKFENNKNIVKKVVPQQSNVVCYPDVARYTMQQTEASRQYDAKPLSFRTGQPQRSSEFDKDKNIVKKVSPKQSNVVRYPDAARYTQPTSAGSNRIINRQNISLARNQEQSHSYEDETENQFSHMHASQQRHYSFEKEAKMADLPISDEEDQFVTLDSTYAEEDPKYNHYQRRYSAETSNTARQSSVTMETTRSNNNMARSYGNNNMSSKRTDVAVNQSSSTLINPKSILKHKTDERKRHLSPVLAEAPQYERPNKVKRNIPERRLKPDIPYRERNTMEVVPSTERGQDMIAEMSIDNAMAAGLEFIHPISGYHCLLCQSFYPDYPTALHHCTLLTHKMKVVKEQIGPKSFSDGNNEQTQQIQTISTRGSMRQTQLSEIAKHYS